MSRMCKQRASSSVPLAEAKRLAPGYLLTPFSWAANLSACWHAAIMKGRTSIASYRSPYGRIREVPTLAIKAHVVWVG
jgi:hypothetical protein